MSNSNYSQVLKRLLDISMHRGIRLGLDYCRQINQALGNPTHAFTAIHIAGTNGKGSVATKVAAGLQASGLNVGLYTSPHISCFRERITINGTMISEDDFAKHVSKVFEIISTNHIPATFFEITTLAAFDYFACQHIDIGVVETGLGGRLDATNILQSKLSIITSISIDHAEILGDTIEKIAYEKAGIIKPNVPVIIGPRLPSQVFTEIAAIQKSPIKQVKGTFVDFHSENEAIAKCALEMLNVPADSISKGLKALPPCRLEIVIPKTIPSPLPKAIILDVGHNPDGLKHLLNSVKQCFPNTPLRFVIGLSKSKDHISCFKILKNAAEYFHIVEGNNVRAAAKELLQEEMLSAGIPKTSFSCEDSVKSGVLNACKKAGRNEEVVIICGTFFIMAEAREVLGISEPRDPEDFNER